MPNTNRPLPIQCPKCQRLECTLMVESATIMLVRCVRCQHAWATQIDWLTPEIREKVHAILHDEEPMNGNR